MATISENLLALNEAKATIKTAIEAKGQDLTNVPFTEYGAAIENLSSGDTSKVKEIISRTITELTAEDLEGITIIGNGAFNYCQQLVSAVIPYGVTTVGSSGFANCNKLTSITISNSITKIPGYFLNGATTLPHIVIPDSIIDIDTYAFNNCKALKSIELPLAPPTLKSVNAFTNVPTACVFYCQTEESLAAYQAATNWSSLTSTYTFAVEE